jgi:hypothetical protein
MAFVARKALNTSSPFPLSDWEFFGYTSLVEVEGFVVVQNPGNYSIAASSKDKFIVWLQDKWLSMREIGEAGPGLGLEPEAWTAGVLFTEPGENFDECLVCTRECCMACSWQVGHGRNAAKSRGNSNKITCQQRHAAAGCRSKLQPTRILPC